MGEEKRPYHHTVYTPNSIRNRQASTGAMTAHQRKPDRILMTADTVGGVWTYALVLAEALGPYGVDVHLATMGEPLSSEQQDGARRLSNLTVHESRYRLEWMKAPWEDVEAAGRWLLDLEERIRPDLVHLNGYAHGALDWQAPVLGVGHSCVFSWFAAVKGEEPPAKWARYRRAVTRGLRQADRVMAPTEAMLDALEQHYGPFERAEAIPNGRKTERFPPREKESFVLTAGRLWDEAKNTAALEEVAPRLDWSVRVAGAEKHPDSGRSAHFKNLVLLGHLSSEALAEQMGRAAIFALPARYEPFGLSVLEAALAGCALVLGDIPSLREVWGPAASFVPPDDTEAFEERLQQLIEDEALREEKARQARERAQAFTPERMARGYLDLYRTLLHDRQTASAELA